MSSVAKSTYTPDEYLVLERKAEYKSEYINGQIYAMSGASREHNIIAGNVFGELREQLKGRPCEAYVNDMRVRVKSTGMYTYPDVVVACNEPIFEDSQLDTLLNPTMIIEVLFPVTEAYDRGEKFDHYRRLESLTDYVMVSQDKIRVEYYVRSVNTGSAFDHWVLSEFDELDGPNGTLQLASIDCAVPLRDIYERVEFPSEDSESASARRPREGWDEQFAEMAKRDDDKLLDAE